MELKDWVEQLKWVIFALAIFLVVFFSMYQHLKSFFGNIKKVSYGKGSLETLPRQDVDSFAETNQKTLFNSSLIDQIYNLLSDESLSQVNQAIEADINLSKTVNLEQQKEALLKYSKVVYIIYKFTDLYYKIYGSQLNFLEFLNTRYSESKKAMKFFFDQAVERNKDFYGEYTYDQWLAFLLEWKLITIDDDTCRITKVGNDFLKFIVQFKLSIVRPY